jgi:hypothetical protein
MSAPKKPASKQPAAKQPVSGGPAGDRIITLALVGTGAFVLTAAAAAISPGAFRMVALLVALALFGIGMLLFLAAYARAISQSRTHVIGVGGVYFLAGCAPRSVQVRLLGALGVQVVVAVVTASARPFTSLAFGILVPMFGVACAGLWGAYHGAFPERRDPRASLPDDD